MDQVKYKDPNTQMGKFPNIMRPAASALTNPFLRSPITVRIMLAIITVVRRTNMS